jgi:hypothetical protein
MMVKAINAVEVAINDWPRDRSAVVSKYDTK